MRFRSFSLILTALLFSLIAPVASAQSDTTAVALTGHIEDGACIYTTGSINFGAVDSTAMYATQAFSLASADLTAPLYYMLDLGTADTVEVVLETSFDRSNWHAVTTSTNVVADTWYASTANGTKGARFGSFQIGAGHANDGTTGTAILNVKVPIRDGIRSECWTINSSR